MERCAKLLTKARREPRRLTALEFRRLAAGFGLKIDRLIRGHVVMADGGHGRRVLVVRLHRRLAPPEAVGRLLDLIDGLDGAGSE